MSAPAIETVNQRALPGGGLGVCLFLISIGILSFVGGLFTDPVTTWRAFHVNFIYYAGLSQAGVVLASALFLVGARWCGPIRHIAAGLSAWVPVTLVLFALSWFGREAIYEPWIHGAPHGKEGWLTITRVFLMDFAILAVLTVLTLSFLKTSFRPHLQGASERLPIAKGLFESWTRDWRGEAEEQEASLRKLGWLTPVIALAYVFGYTFIGFDQVMSLQPTWYSNIFGWYFGWGGWLCAVCATALISVLLRETPGWEGQITRARMHDLGKMVFAFSIFWMYLFFGQYIVIWYGNLPEETQFFEPRLGSQFLQDTWFWASSRLYEPYVMLSMTAWFCCWWVPFWVLLGQEPKRTPAILGTVSFTVLVGFWLERNALIWPSLVPEDGGAWFGAIQIGVAMGFLGGFALVYLLFSRVFPTLPVPGKSS